MYPLLNRIKRQYLITWVHAQTGMIVQPHSLHMRSVEQAGVLVAELLDAIANGLGKLLEAAMSTFAATVCPSHHAKVH
jgi:hypothetical protein